MTGKEKLDAIRARRDPQFAASLLTAKTSMKKAMDKVGTLKGESPVKGVDYFTEEEQEEMIEYIQSQVQDGHTPTTEELLAIIEPLIPEVEPPTQEELLALIKPLIPEVKDGHTPTKTELLSLIVPLIPEPIAPTPPSKKELEAIIKPLIPVVPKADDIIKQVQDDIKKYNVENEFVSKNDINGLIQYLKSGGFRGGGMSSVVHDSTLTGLGTTASPLSVVNGLVPTGATANDVLFVNAAGTAVVGLDGYFEYKTTETYLDLHTDNVSENGALVMTANTRATIFSNYSAVSGISTSYVIDRLFSTGLDKPIGSWGTDGDYFGIKYYSELDDWGIPLLLDKTGIIRNPKSYSGVSNTLAFDTLDGDFIAGDVAGAYTGIALYLYGGAEQFIIGSFLSGNYYNYDNSLATNNFVYAGTAKQIFSETEVGFDTDLKLKTAGNGLYIKEGTNATMGVATLVAGVAVVSTTKVTANSRIFLTRQTMAGTPGTSVNVTARTAGTSFTITSQGSVLDTSTVAWMIVEPA